LLDARRATLKLDKKALDYLVEKGTSDEYGARPLRRIIQKELENVLSSKIISTELQDGDNISVSANKSGLVIKISSKVAV